MSFREGVKAKQYQWAQIIDVGICKLMIVELDQAILGKNHCEKKKWNPQGEHPLKLEQTVIRAFG